MKITAKRLKEIIMEEMGAAYQRDPEPETTEEEIAAMNAALQILKVQGATAAIKYLEDALK